MAFVKKTWLDRVATNLSRRILTIVSGSVSPGNDLVVDVTRGDSDVTEYGSPLNAAALNDLEDRIEDAFESSSGSGEYIYFSKQILNWTYDSLRSIYTHTETIPSGYKYAVVWFGNTSDESYTRCKIRVYISGTSLIFESDVQPSDPRINALLFKTAPAEYGDSITYDSFILPRSSSLSLTIASSAWQTGQAWPSGSAPLGESSSTCDLATITSGTGVSSCVEGDDIKVSEYSQSVCKAPLWVYVGTKTIYVATRNNCAPSDSVTIRGLVLHQ